MNIKFVKIDNEYDENNEPIPNLNGTITTVWAFAGTISKAKADEKSRTIYNTRYVNVVVRAQIDPLTPYSDWHEQMNTFAKIWLNACKRNERHVYEAELAQFGILFTIIGEKYKVRANSLMEMQHEL